MPGARRWGRSHILEGVPATGTDAKCGQVSQIVSVFRPSSKHVHNIVNKRRSLAFAGSGNVANTIELTPFIDCRIIAPYVVEPLIAIGTAESMIQRSIINVICRRGTLGDYVQVELIVEGNHSVIRPRLGSWVWPRFTVRDEHFPSIGLHLQLVKIKSTEVIHEVPFHLAAKDVYL